MKSLNTFINEAKKLDIYQISQALVNLIKENDNDVAGVVESFLDQVAEDLGLNNKEYLEGFKEAILDYAKTW